MTPQEAGYYWATRVSNGDRQMVDHAVADAAHGPDITMRSVKGVCSQCHTAFIVPVGRDYHCPCGKTHLEWSGGSFTFHSEDGFSPEEPKPDVEIEKVESKEG